MDASGYELADGGWVLNREKLSAREAAEEAIVVDCDELSSSAADEGFVVTIAGGPSALEVDMEKESILVALD